MHISDFPLIFNDMEFPIRWQAEYIRLLTTFEVAVELGQGQLLIPSALPQMKPNLPQSRMPEEVVRTCFIYLPMYVPTTQDYTSFNTEAHTHQSDHQSSTNS